MKFFTRLLLINAVAAALCSLFALIAIYLFCEPPADRFFQWVLQALGILTLGIVVQNFTHLRWLQRETVIQRWSPGDTQDFLFETIIELIHFPYKSVLLTSILWVVFSMPAAALFAITVDQSIGNALVVYSFLLASGSTVAFVQDFYSRSYLYPKLEEFLEQQDRDLQRRLTDAPLPFTVRAKLVLQNSFSLIVIVMVTLSAGYAIERNRLRAEQTIAIEEMLSVLAPAVVDRDDANVRDIGNILETFANLMGGGIIVADGDGRILHSHLDGHPGLRKVLAPLIKSNIETSRNWVTAKIGFDDYSLVAGRPWGDFTGDLAYYLYLFMISFYSGCLLIFSISFLASHDISRSVRRIQKWSEQLGNGVLGETPPMPEDDQVAELVFRLDALKVRLSSLLNQMQEGAHETRSVSGRVQEHAVLLRQTTEEDSSLISLTAGFLDRLHDGLKIQQQTFSVLGRHSEDAASSTIQMIPALREVDASSEALSEIVEDYDLALEQLDAIVAGCRQNLSSFIVGAEEAKRSISNLDDVLDHLIETIRRSKQAVLRTASQSTTASDSTHQTRHEIQLLEETMADSSDLLVHLSRTMHDLKIVASAIHEVAEDTKLLSLNAAIRSAKAREEGRSFSVISHTIQDLAAETQSAIQRLMEQIEQLMNESIGLDVHVSDLSESLSTAASEAEASTDLWRQTRSDVQAFDRLDAQFEQFVDDLRRYRDEVRVRQGKFEGHAHLISRLLGDLAISLEQRRRQISEVQERTEQIRNYAGYEVSKGRYASDHFEQMRAMSTHIQSFLVDQIRSVAELKQSLRQLQTGSQDNLAEATEISDGLKRLERAIRRFEEAFGQFNVDSKALQ